MQSSLLECRQPISSSPSRRYHTIRPVFVLLILGCICITFGPFFVAAGEDDTLQLVGNFTPPQIVNITLFPPPQIPPAAPAAVDGQQQNAPPLQAVAGGPAPPVVPMAIRPPTAPLAAGNNPPNGNGTMPAETIIYKPK